MVFSSTIFIFFFLPVTLAGYYIIPSLKWKNVWLLFASLFFYFWGGVSFFPIIIYSIIVNYVFGILVDKYAASNQKLGKILLIIAIILNLANLGYWKYAVFIMETVSKITGISFNIPTILLPIGISFFTFQGMSYVIDVYRRDAKVQKNLLKLGLYIALFPQLIAGPIVRYTEVELQLNNREHNVDKFASGIRVFAIGLAKKAILANSLACVCDPIFLTNYKTNSTLVAWIGIIFYTQQIYFDFSGYSDMAIGLGRMFGFEFPRNFNYPHISLSPSEFWRRWHISLSNWFKDYVYIPIGGSRKGNAYLHLFLIFFLTGLWHGASWNMIAWGVFWASLVVLERYVRKNHLSKHPISIPKPLSWIFMCGLVFIGLTIFRTTSLSDTVTYLGSLLGVYSPEYIEFTAAYYVHTYEIVILLISLIAMLPLGRMFADKVAKKVSNKAYMLLTNGYAIILLLISFMYVVTATYNPFIYFQF